MITLSCINLGYDIMLLLVEASKEHFMTSLGVQLDLEHHNNNHGYDDIDSHCC